MQSKCCNSDIDTGYGFSTSHGFRGLGIYGFCTKCFKLTDWVDDVESNSKEEIEHNKENLNRIQNSERKSNMSGITIDSQYIITKALETKNKNIETLVAHFILRNPELNIDEIEIVADHKGLKTSVQKKDALIKLKAENEKLKKNSDFSCCDNKDYLSALRQLTYDVFFREENQNTAVVDTIWTNDFCTSFDNISSLLNIEVSNWADMEEIKVKLEECLKINSTPPFINKDN